jgi:hypothetical protein
MVTPLELLSMMMKVSKSMKMISKMMIRVTRMKEKNTEMKCIHYRASKYHYIQKVDSVSLAVKANNQMRNSYHFALIILYSQSVVSGASRSSVVSKRTVVSANGSIRTSKTYISHLER